MERPPKRGSEFLFQSHIRELTRFVQRLEVGVGGSFDFFLSFQRNMDNYGNAVSCKDDFSMHTTQNCGCNRNNFRWVAFKRSNTMLLFHNSLSTTDTFLQNLWFSTKNTDPVRSPWGIEHSILHILLKMATGRII